MWGILKPPDSIDKRARNEKGKFEGHMKRFASQIQEFQENVVSAACSLSLFRGEFHVILWSLLSAFPL
jgi:hypothetical protein